MNTLICIALVILSLVALVAVIGAFGLKLFAQCKGKKIEVTNNDNSK